jgi:predicted MFS family arabinose efflux permease
MHNTDMTTESDVTISGRLTTAWRTGPLGVRSFRLLAGGQFTSTIGDFCYAVALPWLVLSNHGSPALLGLILACYGIPRMALIPVGGVLADKVGPRTLMLCADAGRCAVVVALTVLASRHTSSLAALGPPSALIGAGEGLFLPASFSIIPSLVDEGQLAAGNSLSTAITSAGSLLGPALGGALVAITGASTAAFGVDAVSFAVSALTLALIPRRAAPGSPASETDDGSGGESALGVLLRAPALLVVLAVVVAANLGSSGMDAVAIPSLAHAKWGAAGFGALLACASAGGLIGSLAAARTGRLRMPTLFTAAVAGMAIAFCLVPYVGEAGAAAAMLVIGACTGLANVVVLTVVHKQIPAAVLGRVMSAFMLCAFGSYPLSVLVAGLIVRHLGPAPYFPVAGAMLAVVMIAGLTQRGFRRFGTGAGTVQGLRRARSRKNGVDTHS